jgi:hypothetical protein
VRLDLHPHVVPGLQRDVARDVAKEDLMKAMPSTPTAVLAWLERRFPQE